MSDRLKIMAVEEQQMDELIQELKRLRDRAENTDDMNGEYACESMDESVGEAIMECLHEMDSYECLKVLKNSLGLYTFKELVQRFKEICVKYGIKEN